VGKDYALLQGAKDCLEAAKIISEKVKPGTLIVCPWGDQGAAYCVSDGGSDDSDVKKVDAFFQAKIIDSLGTFDKKFKTIARMNCKIYYSLFLLF